MLESIRWEDETTCTEPYPDASIISGQMGWLGIRDALRAKQSFSRLSLLHLIAAVGGSGMVCNSEHLDARRQGRQCSDVRFDRVEMQALP